eukprot:m.21802 g.21802  ORF g.21802 m.21802 type:complete len:675 (-) comp8145_c0_seq1:76-2100(-)
MSGDSQEISLSVDETNQLRAKLGLKPLKEDAPQEGSAPGMNTIANDVLVAPVVPYADKRAQELRDKITASKERREHQKRLEGMRTLGEEAEADDLAAWLAKSRKTDQEKKTAVKKETGANGAAKPVRYDGKDLTGLRVAHDATAIGEAGTILTLRDARVLEEDEDVLENVHIAESERRDYAKKKSHKESSRPALELDEFGNPTNSKGMLSKYDSVDSVTGDYQREDTGGFRIGGQGTYKAQAAPADDGDEPARPTVSLDVLTTTARDYYTPSEMVQFKKKGGKKNTRTRKALTADDLLPLPDESDVKAEPGSMEVDAPKPIVDSEAILEAEGGMRDDAEREAEAQLQAALARARFARIKREAPLLDVAARLSAAGVAALSEKEDGAAQEPAGSGDSIVFSAMGEFVRTVGSSNAAKDAKARRAEAAPAPAAAPEPMDDDEEEEENKPKKSGWTEATQDSKDDVEEGEAAEEDGEESGEEAVQLVYDEGADTTLAATLMMARRKGFLETPKTAAAVAASAVEAAGNTVPPPPDRSRDRDRSDRDRDRGDRDRSDRDRDRSSTARADPFQLPNYHPDVMLVHRDARGRELNEKEAFRELSHAFHGKFPGKAKVEKKLKKEAEQELRKQGGLAETSGTMTLMRKRQQETGSAFVVFGNQMTGGLEDSAPKKPKPSKK